MIIRPFKPAEAEALAILFEDMQAYYEVPCPDRRAIVADLQDLPAGVRIFVAGDDEIVGFAAIGAIYPGPGLRKGLFLKELYVRASSRGQGAGRALLAHLAALALKEGYGRLDWTADPEKADLLRFYESTGARLQSDKIFYRLSGEALGELARAAGTGEDAI